MGLAHLRIEHSGLLIVLTVLAACGRIGSELSREDPDYPVQNPQPSRIVDITGSISSTLDTQLIAWYTTERKQEGCTFSPSALAAVNFPLQVAVPLDIERTGDEFRTVVAVDRFLRGRCGWHFHSLVARISKAGLTSMSTPVLRIPESYPGGVRESSFVNWQPTPVVRRCNFERGTPRTGEEWNFCIGRKGDKHEHVLRGDTRSLDLRILDAATR